MAAVVLVSVFALAGWLAHWPAALFGSPAAASSRSAPGQPGSGPGMASSPGTGPSGGASGYTPSSGSSGSAQQQAAEGLDTLLGQSVSDRSSVIGAYNDVLACGSNLSQDAQSFAEAVQSRQQLISQLASLPSSSALSPSMLQDLSNAWTVSAQADSDYQRWAQDEANDGCTDVKTDSNYVSAESPNIQATADKTAFVSQWDPIAAQYGLTQYQQGNL